jgi:hypothetical protein
VALPPIICAFGDCLSYRLEEKPIHLAVEIICTPSLVRDRRGFFENADPKRSMQLIV